MPEQLYVQMDGSTSTDPGFLRSLVSLINKYSKESVSNTPDIILAKYMNDCLMAYDRAVTAREVYQRGGLG